MYKVSAFQVAISLNIKEIKDFYKATLLFSNREELFYSDSVDKYIYIFKYGVISFFNFSALEISTILDEFSDFSISPFKDNLNEEIELEISGDVNQVHFNKVVLKELDKESIQLIMLNLSQSVAMEHYEDVSEIILADTKQHTNVLEAKGKMDITGIKLKKYIGKTLNLKNQIAENLYILDSPLATWDNEMLNKLDQDLKKMFDMSDRYNTIHERLEIVKENLELFKDIMQHRQSNTLEWIIIILILVEVFDLLITKLIK